jgi:predicted  nucleic acid-binding Zn-ribbon protein
MRRSCPEQVRGAAHLKLTAAFVCAALIGFGAVGYGQDKSKLPKGQPFQILQQQIDDLKGRIGRIADLQAQVDALALLVEQNTASIGQLREYDKQQEKLIGALQGELAHLRARVAAAENDVEALQAISRFHAELVGELMARLQQIDARLAADGHDIQLLFDRDQAKQTLIVVLQEQAVFLSARIAALEAASTDHASEIALLQNQLNTVNADLQRQLDQKQERITEICPAGSSIRQVNANGTVACEHDDDTSLGVGQLQYVTFSSVFPVAPNTAGGGTKSCPTGYVMTGGGFSGLLPNVPVVRSEPVNNSWQVTVANGAAPAFVTVSVRCVALMP